MPFVAHSDLYRPGLVLPIVKPPANASKKPLRRVPIEEISTAGSANNKRSSQTPVFASRTEPSVNRTSNTSSVPSSVSSTSAKPETKITEIASSQSKDLREAEPPTTLYQLISETRDFRKSDPSRFYVYFSLVPVANYVRFFGDSLDNDLLCSLLNAFSAQLEGMRAQNGEVVRETAVHVANALLGLTKVRRFATVAMFLGANEKRVVRDICNYLAAFNFPDLHAALVETIKKAYL